MIRVRERQLAALVHHRMRIYNEIPVTLTRTDPRIDLPNETSAVIVLFHLVLEVGVKILYRAVIRF